MSYQKIKYALESINEETAAGDVLLYAQEAMEHVDAGMGECVTQDKLLVMGALHGFDTVKHYLHPSFLGGDEDVKRFRRAIALRDLEAKALASAKSPGAGRYQPRGRGYGGNGWQSGWQGGNGGRFGGGGGGRGGYQGRGNGGQSTPATSGRGGGAKGACFACGEMGHIAFQCPTKR